MVTTHVPHAEEVLETHAPNPSMASSQPTYVWDVVVRITHWTVVLSMLGLAATGVYIGHPFILAPGRAGGHFVMGWAKVLHFCFAIAFTLAVCSRVVWMFLGKGQARWRQFIPTSRRRFRGLLESFKFYLFLRDTPPRFRGHNPLAATMYVGVFALYALMILTGFTMYSASSYGFMHVWQFLIPVFHGLTWARWIHHITMYLLLFFVINHVYSAILCSNVEKNGTVDSIISGYKFLPTDIPASDDDPDVE